MAVNEYIAEIHVEESLFAPGHYEIRFEPRVKLPCVLTEWLATYLSDMFVGDVEGRKTVETRVKAALRRKIDEMEHRGELTLVGNEVCVVQP